MPGPEFSVESVTYGGVTTIVTITKKRSSSGGYFVELGHTVPAMLQPEDLQAMCATVRDAIAALGITHSVTHTEVKLTPDGPKIVEIGARLAGGRIPELVELALGVDLWDATLSLALGEVPDLQSTRNQAACIRFLSASPGVIRHITGVEQARSLPGVLDVHVERKPGDNATPLRSNLDRIGDVIAVGDTAFLAEDRTEQALGHITIQVDSEELQEG